MKRFFSEIIIIIIFLNIGKCSEVISLNLAYRYYNNMESPLSMYLYTNSQIGTPKMNIYSYIHSDKKQNLFSMYKVIYNLKESEEKQYYNYTISKTFKNISCIGIKYVISTNDIHAKEKFYFNIYNNKTKLNKEKEIEDLNFILGVDLFKKYGTYFLNLGFPMVNEKTLNDRFKYDLIMQLKQRKIIDGYDWFILYDSNFDKGENIIKAEEISNLNPILIIGTPPHYYNKAKFYQSQLLKTYSDLYFWSITFKDIYLYINTSGDQRTKISTEVDTVEIYLDDIMIYGPMYYLNIVNTRFFLKYKNSCNIEKDPNFKFYCKKSEEFGINELKQFPNLYFDNVDLIDYVIIHDAARPLVSAETITACLEGCREHDGVMPALPVKDTVYYGAGGKIESLLDRSRVIAGQAPEAFRFEKYYGANLKLLPDRILQINGSTEPAILAGMEVQYIPGDERNFKITTQTDLERFREIVSRQTDT